MSNPFRRKQNAILGLDNSSYISTTDDVASAVARFPELDQSPREPRKVVRIVSPDLSRENESDRDSYHSASIRSDRSDISRYERNDTLEDNPFSEESEEDSLDEDDAYPTRTRKPKRKVPSKASQTLNIDSDNPWRTSTVIGNLPGTGKDRPGDVNAVSAKAQRMLGMSSAGRLMTEDDFRREHSLSPHTDNVAPKALRTLGIPTNPFHRPGTSNARSTTDENPRHGLSRTNSQRGMNVDEFKRLLLSGTREFRSRTPPPNRFANDSSSNTDSSSISRSSMLSSQCDHRTETPRSSQGNFPDDAGMKQYSNSDWPPQRTPVSRYQRPLTAATTESYVDPAAVLTRPFLNQPYSPIDPDSPTSFSDLNKPLPSRPESVAYELAASPPKSRIPPTPPVRRRSQQKEHEFIAELPVPETVIAELPGDNKNDPVSDYQIPHSRFAPVPPPPRRTGSYRDSVAELSGSTSLPRMSAEPSIHVASQQQLRYMKGPLSENASSNPAANVASPTNKIPLPPPRTSSLSQHPAQQTTHDLLQAPGEKTSSRNAPSLPPISTNSSSNNLASLPSTSGIAPPPPPPRRRTSSDGGRANKSRSSGEVGNKKIAASQARSMTPPPSFATWADATPPSPSTRHVGLSAIAKAAITRSSADVISPLHEERDVMADLGTLQQDVDALRGLFGTGGEREESYEKEA